MINITRAQKNGKARASIAGVSAVPASIKKLGCQMVLMPALYSI
jgi:hypothetical protein